MPEPHIFPTPKSIKLFLCVEAIIFVENSGILVPIARI